jgi:nucleotide-binding universal stress UspA family protein/GNAT superfamily N-acetyltransferase
VTVKLRDGSRIDIRPIGPDDREILAEGFERLSPESRYRRFFGPMPELSKRFLDYLTVVDHHDHEALVALDAETGEGVGVARYVRTKPDVAEPAVVVIDDWQGRGVASVLLDRLVERARDEGIARFEAPVLATNRDAIAVLEGVGRTTQRPEGREVQLTIDLPQPGVALPWHSVLREVAVGTIQPARTLIERIWPRRLGEPSDERRNVIVVGTDGSDHASMAVDTAASLAAASGATVDVVGAHRFLPPDQSGVTAAVQDAAGTLRDRGLHVQEHVRRGDPALVLTDRADELAARLIVVGAGDRGKVARRLMGSTADFVAERSPCDVLIVRPGPAPEPARDAT